MLDHTSAKMPLDAYADLFDDLDAVATALHGRYSPKPEGEVFGEV
jgi:hypothetical protein